MKNNHLFIYSFLLMGLFSYTTINIISPKKLESLIDNWWEGAQYTNKSTELAKRDHPLFEFHDINNEVYTIQKDQLLEGLLCIRANHTPPFENWSGIDRSLEIYDPLHKKSVYETITYAIALEKDLSIKQIKVLNFQSEYAPQIRSKNWLKQFIGFKGGELEYGKDIDAVSGATVSAKDFTEDITATYQGLKVLYGNLSDAPN